MAVELRPRFGGYAALLFLVFLLLLTHHTCSARNNKNFCSPSSCGTIHNISYPFRLKADPRSCGDRKYELTCENSSAILYFDKAKYYVQAIDYNNFRIRLVDANIDKKNNCASIPHYSLVRSRFYGFGYDEYDRLQDTYLLQILTFVTCSNPVSSPLYVSTSSCSNNNITDNSSVSSAPYLKGFNYVMIGGSLSDLRESCRIDSMSMISWMLKDLTNISYKIIHDRMMYGFELSWLDACCSILKENRCGLDPISLRNICSGSSTYYNTPLASISDWMTRRLLRIIGKWIPSYSTGGNWIEYRNYNKGPGESQKHVLDITIDTAKFQVARGTISSNSPVSIFLIVLLIVLLVFNVSHRAPLFFCGVPCLVIFLIYKWRRRHLSMFDTIEQFLQSHNLIPIRYSYSDMKKMTTRFKEKLGEGGYGSVYKGKLRSGRFAAIKLLSKSKTNGQEFINEVATIGRIHHVNVVQLIGFCAEGSRRALIYEFMPNGSLDKFIFSREDSILLDNDKIFEIALGVARGIEYLHRGCDMQILHFDIKPHNILLDENFIPKVSDFGLAKLYPSDHSIVSLTAARGTMGYIAPELFYKNLGGVSYKADVYSFGKLLIEMIGKRKNLNAHADHSSQIYFSSWIYDELIEGKLDLEKPLGDHTTEQEMKTTKKMIIVALWCIQLKPDDRPSMHEVIEMLNKDVECLQIPPKPFPTPYHMPKEDGSANPINLAFTPNDCIDSSYMLGR